MPEKHPVNILVIENTIEPEITKKKFPQLNIVINNQLNELEPSRYYTKHGSLVMDVIAEAIDSYQSIHIYPFNKLTQIEYPTSNSEIPEMQPILQKELKLLKASLPKNGPIIFNYSGDFRSPNFSIYDKGSLKSKTLAYEIKKDWLLNNGFLIKTVGNGRLKKGGFNGNTTELGSAIESFIISRHYNLAEDNHERKVRSITPGVNILVAGETAYESPGTSFSTPLISAIVAEILKINPKFSRLDVKNILRLTADASVENTGTSTILQVFENHINEKSYNWVFIKYTPPEKAIYDDAMAELTRNYIVNGKSKRLGHTDLYNQFYGFGSIHKRDLAKAKILAESWSVNQQSSDKIYNKTIHHSLKKIDLNKDYANSLTLPNLGLMEGVSLKLTSSELNKEAIENLTLISPQGTIIPLISKATSPRFYKKALKLEQDRLFTESHIFRNIYTSSYVYNYTKLTLDWTLSSPMVMNEEAGGVWQVKINEGVNRRNIPIADLELSLTVNYTDSKILRHFLPENINEFLPIISFGPFEKGYVHEYNGSLFKGNMVINLNPGTYSQFYIETQNHFIKMPDSPFHNLKGSFQSDVVIGNSESNEIYLFDGDDVVEDSHGPHDIIHGGQGFDTYYVEFKSSGFVELDSIEEIVVKVEDWRYKNKIKTSYKGEKVNITLNDRVLSFPKTMEPYVTIVDGDKVIRSKWSLFYATSMMENN